MSDQFLAQNDPRSVEELINVALTNPDDDTYWDAIVALHWKESSEVFGWAENLCHSVCPMERRIGANILPQVGIPNPALEHQCSALLIKMLSSEDDSDVLHAILMALPQLDKPGIVEVVSKYAMHSDPNVRFAVAYALMGKNDQEAVDLLIKLTSDLDSDVRDWATFGLGTQLFDMVDTPEIRNALVARLDDPDDDTRGEAMIGLALRKDERAIPAIQKDLELWVTEKALEAAAYIGSPQLLPVLYSLRSLPNLLAKKLEPAIVACTPPPS